jgi:hypothetical protein
MKKQKSITIDEKLIELVEALAEKESRNFSNMLEVLIQEAVSKREQ